MTTIIFTSPPAASRLRIEQSIRGLSCPEITRCKLAAIRRVPPFGRQPIKVPPHYFVSNYSESSHSRKDFGVGSGAEAESGDRRRLRPPVHQTEPAYPMRTG